MQLVINTGSLSFDTRAAIAEVNLLGFSAVEVNLQGTELRYDFQRKPNLDLYMLLVRELALRKLTVSDVHAVFLNTPQMFSSRVRCELLKIEAQIVRTLGAHILVVHPTDILHSEEALEAFAAGGAELPAAEGMAEVIRELQSDGFQIALENVQHWNDRRTTNDAEIMARLVEALDCYVTLDVRRCLEKPSLARWLELVRDRIVVLHLHDSVGGQEHKPPAAPDWRQIIPQLKTTPAQVYVMEATGERSPGAIRASREYITKLMQTG